MSGVVVSPSEQPIHRPTSDRIVYDVRSVFVGDEPRVIHENFRTPLADTIEKLSEMLSWPENWDGRGAVKPNTISILRALRWIFRMRTDATLTGELWQEPHVVADEDGDVVFEWSKGERTLSVYVSPDKVEYLKVWGLDVHSEMEDGEVEARNHQTLWRWLMSRG